MVKVSQAALTKYRSIAEKLQNRVRAAREKGEQVIEQGTRTAVIGGTAFALGVVQGRTGGVEILGAPLDLLVGAGAHAAGFMKLGGKNSHHLHNIGDGAIALYAGTMGRAFGVTWKTTGKFGLPSGGARVAGAFPAHSGSDSLSDQDLANAVVMRR